MINNQKYLLPVGFYDLLGQEASSHQKSVNVLLQTFIREEYQFIKTPLVEFEESLNGNQRVDNGSFKMVDNFSGKTLVIRNDITPQISRLFATKLKNQPLPLKLCYAGDVLKTRNDHLYADRQLTQVGIELIGDNGGREDVDIINLTLLSLKKVEISNLMINFCLPQFLDIMVNSLDLSEESTGVDKGVLKKNLKQAISSKNLSDIKKYGGIYSDNLIVLVLENSDFTKIKEWQKSIEDIKNCHPEISMSVDIFGDEEFLYHKEIGFTIFKDGISYPVARGGKYQINDKILAMGSTIYVNNLLRTL